MFNNDRQIVISEGNSRRAAKWNACTYYWSEFVERLQTPARGTETYDAYMHLAKPQQDDLKDVGGFVAGTLRDGRRKGNAVTGRDMLTLDLDHIPAGATDNTICRVDGLACGYAIYSTRKHAPHAPRLRILLPLDRTVTADEYEPIARMAAKMIGIELCDPTTFEASRLMYWPSCCADSQYVYQYGDKPFLSADGMLALYPDWHDVNAWPQVPGVTDNHQRLAAKQGNPTEKNGVVGAFCRVYDIYSAMDKFLPGIYVPCDNMPDRYTYTAGSTTGGAVVYDNGLFLFSHHATDPCGGKLVNAFDLVRLHIYGDKDDDAQPGTPTNRLPSYTEMCKFAAQDTDVAAILAKERYEKAAKTFSTAPGETSAGAANWMALLEPGGPNGGYAKTLQNYKIIISNDPNFKGKIRLNLFSSRVDVIGVLPWARPGNSLLWCDTDTTELRAYMEPIIGKASKNDVADAVDACAKEQAYHPVRDYLNSLSWDGVSRLDTLFIDYLGAANTPYIRAVTRKSFTAAVARVMTPGIKYDTMPVIVGTQGRFKSTLLAKMGGAWFSDSLRNFGTKDAMETLQGTWLNEIAEMQAMNASEIDAVKAFLSKLTDYYRAAYGHYTADRPRQCVFFGTTNTHDCLRDTTGGRRFWPVDIDRQPRIKNVFKDLDEERNQLWAEAVTRWRLGETLFLPPELEAEAGVIQEDHRERHPWEGAIEQFVSRQIPEDWPNWDLNQRTVYQGGSMATQAKLITRTRVCAAEIWCELLGKAKGDMQQRFTREINQLLERLPGWVSVGVREAGKPYGKQRCFELHLTTDNQATGEKRQQIDSNSRNT